MTNHPIDILMLFFSISIVIICFIFLILTLFPIPSPSRAEMQKHYEAEDQQLEKQYYTNGHADSHLTLSNYKHIFGSPSYINYYLIPKEIDNNSKNSNDQ